MAVRNRAVEAIMDAQIAMAQAGYRMPEMTVNESCYFSALVACVPDVQRRRDGAVRRLVYAEWTPAETPDVSERGGCHEIWVTPGEQNGFELYGPQGAVKVWKGAP